MRGRVKAIFILTILVFAHHWSSASTNQDLVFFHNIVPGKKNSIIVLRQVSYSPVRSETCFVN